MNSKGTDCLISSGERSSMSFPWTTPALLTNMVGWPICRMRSKWCKTEGIVTYLFNDLLRHFLDLFQFCDIAFIIIDVI